MRRLNKRKAHPDEQAHVREAVKFCNKHSLNFAGFYFDDPLSGPDGIYLYLYVPPGADEDHIQTALRQAYNERDVVAHYVVECPPEWLL